MDEQRKYATLFAATILAARKLNDTEARPGQYTSTSRTQSRKPTAFSKRSTNDGPVAAAKGTMPRFRSQFATGFGGVKNSDAGSFWDVRDFLELGTTSVTADAILRIITSLILT